MAGKQMVLDGGAGSRTCEMIRRVAQLVAVGCLERARLAGRQLPRALQQVLGDVGRACGVHRVEVQGIVAASARH